MEEGSIYFIHTCVRSHIVVLETLKCYLHVCLYLCNFYYLCRPHLFVRVHTKHRFQKRLVSRCLLQVSYDVLLHSVLMFMMC